VLATAADWARIEAAESLALAADADGAGITIT
jgi:hypothetical protein